MAFDSARLSPSDRLPGGWTAPAPAKINRFLHIIGRRADGYHALETGFQFTDWCDHVHLALADTLALVEDPLGLGQDNLVMKAARLFFETTGIPGGCQIALEKHLPDGAGLGGGSSDAATTLVILNTLHGHPLTQAALMALGSHLGADLPIFIFGRSAFATGIGDACDAEDWGGSCVLIATPPLKVETGAVFSHPKLTRDTPSCRIRASQLAMTRNDCEPVVRNSFPEIDRLFTVLAPFGKPRLTGTGSSVIVIDPDQSQHAAFSEARALASVHIAALMETSVLYTANATA